ncbi:hypothetical protein BT63DRAFT_462641 [Microthyrium microscopicum]|uniref:Zinc finger PHD-type domain-containing protein n=1 Tax=Microthyrium microscopicum TaxID=703497 RepID=A0A6A6UUQ9_9PEZI|nr:hypothetical protein BT63DRAFT_462641 [Microthyrium microscopicum]
MGSNQKTRARRQAKRAQAAATVTLGAKGLPVETRAESPVPSQSAENHSSDSASINPYARNKKTKKINTQPAKASKPAAKLSLSSTNIDWADDIEDEEVPQKSLQKSITPELTWRSNKAPQVQVSPKAIKSQETPLPIHHEQTCYSNITHLNPAFMPDAMRVQYEAQVREASYEPPKPDSLSKLVRQHQEEAEKHDPYYRADLDSELCAACDGQQWGKLVFVQCQKCERAFHKGLHCAGMKTRTLLELAVEPLKAWTCDDCRGAKPLKAFKYQDNLLKKALVRNDGVKAAASADAELSSDINAVVDTPNTDNPTVDTPEIDKCVVDPAPVVNNEAVSAQPIAINTPVEEVSSTLPVSESPAQNDEISQEVSLESVSEEWSKAVSKSSKKRTKRQQKQASKATKEVEDDMTKNEVRQDKEKQKEPEAPSSPATEQVVEEPMTVEEAQIADKPQASGEPEVIGETEDVEASIAAHVSQVVEGSQAVKETSNDQKAAELEADVRAYIKKTSWDFESLEKERLERVKAEKQAVIEAWKMKRAARLAKEAAEKVVESVTVGEATTGAESTEALTEKTAYTEYNDNGEMGVSEEDVVASIEHDYEDDCVPDLVSLEVSLDDSDHEPVVLIEDEPMPDADAPDLEFSKVESPIVETPAVDAPIVDAPLMDAPMADAPVVETPIANFSYDGSPLSSNVESLGSSSSEGPDSSVTAYDDSNEPMDVESTEAPEPSVESKIVSNKPIDSASQEPELIVENGASLSNTVESSDVKLPEPLVEPGADSNETLLSTTFVEQSNIELYTDLPNSTDASLDDPAAQIPSTLEAIDVSPELADDQGKLFEHIAQGQLHISHKLTIAQFEPSSRVTIKTPVMEPDTQAQLDKPQKQQITDLAEEPSSTTAKKEAEVKLFQVAFPEDNQLPCDSSDKDSTSSSSKLSTPENHMVKKTVGRKSFPKEASKTERSDMKQEPDRRNVLWAVGGAALIVAVGVALWKSPRNIPKAVANYFSS